MNPDNIQPSTEDLSLKNENLDQTNQENIKKTFETKRNDDDPDKIIITIQYCGTSGYAKQYEDLKKEILGNSTNIEVFGQEFPVPPVKKLLSRVVTGLQFGLIIISVGGETVRNYLPFIPPAVFRFLDEKNGW